MIEVSTEDQPTSIEDDYIKKYRFWDLAEYDNKIQKNYCKKFNSDNSLRFITDWLPAFGFGRYKDDENVEDNGLIVQQLGYFWDDEIKFGSKVSILGGQKDSEIRHLLINWIIDGIKYLDQKVAGLTIPKNVLNNIRAMGAQNDFFKHMHYYLPYLREVDSIDPDTGRPTQIKQLPVRDFHQQGVIVFDNGLLTVQKEKGSKFVSYPHFRSKNPRAFFWVDSVKSHKIKTINEVQSPKGYWWDFLQNCCKEQVNNE